MSVNKIVKGQQMKLMIRLCLLLLLCFPVIATATITEQLKKDFAPLSGIIIMPIGDEYLVDLDSTSDLKTGDILTLVMAGEKIIHPETKEILGSVERSKGFLQVTKVKFGYSYAKLLGTATAPEKGDRVKRFTQVPAIFNGPAADKKLASELQLALPQLNWLDSNDKTVPELIFSLTENSLIVTNKEGAELKQYNYNAGELTASGIVVKQVNSFSSAAPKKSFLNQSIDTLATSVGLDNKDSRLEHPGITQQLQTNSDVWMSPNLKGNPIGIAVADFDGDGQLETAIAMSNELQIMRFTAGKLELVTTVEFAAAVNLLSIDSLDMDNDGKSELYLSANVRNRLASKVVEFTQGIYKNTISSVPWFLRVADLPQGRTLLAQATGNTDNPFKGKPFVVLKANGKLQRGDEIDLPAAINVFSFTPLQGANNETIYASISSRDYLKIMTAEESLLWESADHFGGSDTVFFNEEDTNINQVEPIYIQQRLLKLRTGEILVPHNHGTRITERVRNFKKSNITAFKWDGTTLQENWQTIIQPGYLSDFTIADADNDGELELVMAVRFEQKKLFQNGRSNLIIYELN